MEVKRICPECLSKYEPTRSDQKFCTTSCRWNAWHKKQKGSKKSKGLKGLAGISEPEKKQEKPQIDLFASLRNVPVTIKTQTEVKQEPTQTTSSPISEQQKPTELKKQEPVKLTETKEYQHAKANRDKISDYRQKALSLLETCNVHINETNHALAVLANIPNKNRFMRWSVDMEDLFGTQREGHAMNIETERKKLESELQKFHQAKAKIITEAGKAISALQDADQRLKSIKQYEEPKLGEVLRGIMAKIQAEEEKDEPKREIEEEVLPLSITEKEPNEQEIANLFQTPQTFEQEAQINNPKIVSSSQIRDMRFGCFPFTGKWKEFLGEPQLGFHLGIHGQPGGGKSTFCVQLADYLARNFGKVIYVSGEEGLTKTVQDKIVNNGINNPYLFFADIRSYEEIKTEIPNVYHFIFIDSLDTLKIDAQKLRSLKEFYPQSAFITISQSTKDGKMRGSQEIMHDNDITVSVIRPGIAATTKNRFGRIGLEFKIFDLLEAAQKKTETKLIVTKSTRADGRLI